MERGKLRLVDVIWDYDDYYQEVEIVEKDVVIVRNFFGRGSGGSVELFYFDFFFYFVFN